MNSAPESQAPESRNPIGWIILALLFLLLGFSAVSASLRPKTGVARPWIQEQSQLSSAMRLAALPGGEAQRDTVLHAVYARAASAAPADRMASRLRLVTGHILGKKNNPKDLARLRESQTAEVAQRLRRPLKPVEAEEVRERDVADRALVDGLGGEKTTQAQAERLAEKLPDHPFVYRLAEAEIRHTAGDKDALNRLPSTREVVSLVVMAGVLGLLALASIVAWIVFGVYQLNAGTKISAPPVVGAPTSGFALGNTTPTDADRLAIRAALLFGGFLIISQALGYVLRGLPQGVVTLLIASTMLAYVFAISKVPIMGKSITLADQGLRGPGYPRLIALGVFGFLLELPVTIAMGTVGTRIFSFLPAPEHPATTGLAQNPTLVNILSTLFFGAIVAPFWEEIMFRGSLFPALSRLLKSPWTGGFLSSLLFAAIHPQGPSLWLALGSVAAFSCALAYQTRSLWPSVVLHVCHNSTLLLLQVLMS